MDRTKNFYRTLFDWEITNDPRWPDMEMIATGTEPGGAFFRGPPEMPLMFNAYVKVDDIDETLGKVEKAGGTVIMPRTEVPPIGWFAVFRDPEGVVLSLFQERTQE